MLQIWIINHYASEQGRHSFFATELSKRGHKVVLFASSFLHYIYKETKEYANNKHAFREESEDGFSRVWIKTTAYQGNDAKRMFNQLIFAVNVVRFGLRMKDVKPDVIIGSSVHLFTGLAAYILAKKLKVPFIFEVRDLWPQTLIDLGALTEKGLLTIFLKTLEKFLYKKAASIISVLPDRVQYIESLGIDRNKVIYIPNGVDLEWFDKNVKRANTDQFDQIDQFFTEHTGKTIFTYTGAMGIANGLDTLIKAIDILKTSKPDEYARTHFLLMGDGPEKQALMELVEKLSIENITFFEYVSKNMIPYVLLKSVVCITIVKKSNVHRFGVSMNKTYDYLASAKPLISVVGASTEIATDADCGLAVEPDQPEALADAIVRMNQMRKEDRQKFGQNGRFYVEENHDYKVLTSKLLHVIYESIAQLSDVKQVDKRIMIVGSLDLSLVLFRKELIDTWLKAGYEVIAAAPGKSVLQQLESIGVIYHDIPIERTGLNPARDLLVLFRLWRLYMLEKPNYLFLYTIKPVVYGSLAAAVYKKAKVFSMITGLGYVFMEDPFCGKPVSDRLGDIARIDQTNGLKNSQERTIRLRFLKNLVIWLYRIALKGNERVFFQNPDDIDAFVSLQIVRPEMVTKTNGSGVNLEHYSVQAETVKDDNLENRVTFLLIARLLVEKGVREYVAAARAIKRKYAEARFMLVGWSFEENPSAISSTQVEAWREEGLVEIFGETNDVRPYIASSSVYVLPSYREGTPRTVLEAMAMGKPIITTDVPGCRETVVDGFNGFLVKVKDKDMLAEAMEKFIVEPELIKTMGAASRRFAEEKYDVHKVNQVINEAMGLDIQPVKSARIVN